MVAQFVAQEYEDGVVPLISGQLYERQGSPFRWTWYAIPLLSIDADNATVYHNVLVEIDAVDTFPLGGVFTWASFDVMVVNESLPFNAQTQDAGPVQSGSPMCWFNELCLGGYYARYDKRHRVTSSFGYNSSSPGGQVTVWACVHCSGHRACTLRCTACALHAQSMRVACACHSHCRYHRCAPCTSVSARRAPRLASCGTTCGRRRCHA